MVCHPNRNLPATFLLGWEMDSTVLFGFTFAGNISFCYTKNRKQEWKFARWKWCNTSSLISGSVIWLPVHGGTTHGWTRVLPVISNTLLLNWYDSIVNYFLIFYLKPQLRRLYRLTRVCSVSKSLQYKLNLCFRYLIMSTIRQEFRGSGDFPSLSSQLLNYLSQVYVNWYSIYFFFWGGQVKTNWQMEEMFVVEAHQGSMSYDQTPRHPITASVNSPDEIDGIFDTVTYSKAASVLRMLKYVVTEKRFRQSLKEYLYNNK